MTPVPDTVSPDGSDGDTVHVAVQLAGVLDAGERVTAVPLVYVCVADSYAKEG